ncbi:MAG: YcaQ family DNA glycosylase [Cytophagales bacterium]|nr:YcaQ family DNA glycosylase [Armatimonadota bacterium]
MTQQTVILSAIAVRRFLIHAFALEGFQTLPDIPAAIAGLESIQEDSINVCGRIHDLILWARVRDYATALLHQSLYEAPRQAFEYYFPNLHVLPVGEYRYFVRAMHARRAPADQWRGLTPEEMPVAERLLERLDAQGPLRTRAAGSADGHTTSGWGARQTVASRVTEKLWLQGYLSVARRENFERWFERTERCLPPECAALHHKAAALPTHEEEAIYLLRKRLRTRRLFRLPKSGTAILGEGAFVRVEVEGDPRPWHALAEDAARLEAAASLAPTREAHLLAPLDPLVYDRDRNRALWGFDYTWEVYTPQAKRRWGYYVLPILVGDSLVGRVDPKLDRKTGILTLHSLILEPGADADTVAGPILARLFAFARFLGAARFAFEKAAVPEAFHEPLSNFKG